MFRAIASDNFAPFEKLRLELPAVPDKPADLAEVHLFTGVNGTGKTRILSVLSAMLGNSQHLQKRMKGAKAIDLFATNNFRDYDSLGNYVMWSKLNASTKQASWPTATKFANWCGMVPAFAYSGYAYVTDAEVSAMNTIPKPDRNYCLSFNKAEATSQILLQAITNLLFVAAVDSLNVLPENNNSKAARLVKSLEATLFEITGTKFQFKIERFPQISIFVVWGNDRLPFDVLPDGLRAIIGWLVHAIVITDVWLQGEGDPANTEAVFLLDEIESHLHPAWQRKILPAFQKLFPKSQIFVATHSPFVIASLNHGWIHSLKMENGKVRIENPKAASKGDSYISVVEDIMGIKEWFDPETEKLLAAFRSGRDLVYQAKTPEERAPLFENAKKLALEISTRSTELDFMMGKELNQLERHLAKGK